ncbi:5'-nucleotidase, lipoprotein e(P4) family [Dyella silvatica]|uniref:5'-nucleotidase, lipoprotein e(P4) family n=1 Tax=Dyella silvatica TaxID=2992128 RepID=UPI00225809F7|nr:HAD family acid phosphatase [Dyella silvatica]
MSIRLPVTATVLGLLSACAAAPTQPPQKAAAPAALTPAATTIAANDNLNAVAWSQTAIEHDLIYLQTYRDAQSRLLAALKDPHWDALPKSDRTTPLKGLKPAIVLDIDETVLDNSPYQARLIQGGGDFNEASWAAWCKEENARALPGAVEFTQFAAKHGIAVIYISNRAKDLDAATLANLHKAGLPVAGPSAFLGLGTVVPDCEQAGSDKGCHRQLVGRHYRVLMQFGDQIGDFVDVMANNAEGRQKAMTPYLPWIGSRWFVLPNPTYGSWEPALFDNDWAAPHQEQRRQKINALRVQ